MLLTVLVLVAELPSQRDVPYIVFPLLIWAALRFGPRGASLSLLVVVGVDGAQHGAQHRPVRARVDHRQPAVHSAVPGDRGGELADSGRRHRRARHRRCGVARQRGAAAVGRAVHGRGVDRPRVSAASSPSATRSRSGSSGGAAIGFSAGAPAT